MNGFGVALSGGGCLGAAHLGVMRALQEWGVHPAVCVGTSAGGLVAGGLGAGVPLQDLTAFWRHVCAVPHWYELQAVAQEEWRAVRTGSRLGLATLAPALHALGHHAPRQAVDEWIEGYAVMTVDIGVGKLLAIGRHMAEDSHGSQAHDWSTPIAWQATSALPGLFAGVADPVGRPTSLYVDGGLQDNLPIDVAFSLGATHVMSVNVGLSFPLPPLPAKLTLAEVVQRAVAYGTATLTVESNTPQRGPVLRVNPLIPQGAGLLTFRDFDALEQAGYKAACTKRTEIESLAKAGAVA